MRIQLTECKGLLTVVPAAWGMCGWAVSVGERAVLWARGEHSYALRAFWKPTGFSISLTTQELFMEKLPSFAEQHLFAPSTPCVCPFPTCSAPREAVLCVYINGSIPLLFGFLWDSDHAGRARGRLEGERRRTFLTLCLHVIVLRAFFFFFFKFPRLHLFVCRR